MQRHALAGSFQKRRAKDRDRLLEPGGAALALAQRPERVAQIILRCPSLLRVRRGIKLEPCDLNRDQEIEIDPLLVTALIERFPPFSSRCETSGCIIGMFQRHDPCHPLGSCECVAAQNVLLETGLKKGNPAANRGCAAFGF